MAGLIGGDRPLYYLTAAATKRRYDLPHLSADTVHPPQ
jgi:hypothetical protein